MLGKWKIFRLMIDQAHQRCGYAYAAMRAIIEALAAQPDCDKILISYQRDNVRARQLYARLGFIEQQDADGHYSATFQIDPALV